MKTVIHLLDGSLLKGFLDHSEDEFQEAAARSALAAHVDLRLASGERRHVDLSAAKALFLVKSFEGQPQYDEVKFFHDAPDIEGLWVRVRFLDREITEGIVHNSLPFFSNAGFFLKPPDPQSNNRMIYILKKSLAELQVLGIRNKY